TTLSTPPQKSPKNPENSRLCLKNNDLTGHSSHYISLIYIFVAFAFPKGEPLLCCSNMLRNPFK
ncbi:hypothetical protein, partial [Acetobacter indonesiensis]|uniref:hypothetical protein n=1 Tax=Acetobacter indonesiensis TaxID=104101 RepID=UPI00066238D4